MLGNLTAYLTLNMNDFSAKIQRAMRETRNFANNYNTALSNMARTTRDNDKQLGNMAKSLKAIGNASGLLMLGSGFYSIAKACNQAALEMQGFQVQYEAVFKSAEAGEREFANVRGIADKYGLNLQVTAEAYAKFQAATETSTITTMQAKKAFEGLSVGMAGLHLNSSKVERIFIQIQQMMSKGIVQAEELRVVAESLPGAYGAVAISMGKTGTELAEMMRKGQLKSVDMIQKLSEYLEKRYGPAAAKAAKMAMAEQQRFTNEVFNTKVMFGETLMPTITNGLKYVVIPLLKVVHAWVMGLKMAFAAVAGAFDVFKKIHDRGGLFGAMFSPKQAINDIKVSASTVKGMWKDELDNFAGWGGKKRDYTIGEKISEAERVADIEAREAIAKQEKADAKAAKSKGGGGGGGAKDTTVQDAIKGLKELEKESKKAFSKDMLDPYISAMTTAEDKIADIKEKLGAHLNDKGVAATVDAISQKIRENTSAGFFTKVNEVMKKQVEETTENIKNLKDVFDKNELEKSIAAAQQQFLKTSEVDAAEKNLNRMTAIQKKAYKEWKKNALDAVTAQEVVKKQDDIIKQLISDFAKAEQDLKNINFDATLLPIEVEIRSIDRYVEESKGIWKQFFEGMKDGDKIIEDLISRLNKLANKQKEISFATVLANYNRGIEDRKKNQEREMQRTRSTMESLSTSIPFFSDSKRKREKLDAHADFDSDSANQELKRSLDMKRATATTEAQLSEVNRLFAQFQKDRENFANNQVKIFDEQNLQNSLNIIEDLINPINLLKDALDGMSDALADTLLEFAQTGRFDFSEMASAMAKQLQMVAAAKTAELLMQSLFCGIMSLVSLARKDFEAAAGYGKAAGAAAAGAAMMGSFLAGTMLTGQAHSGIESIPEDGTWLLQKNERVVDSKTNQDLKQYIKAGNKPSVNMTVNINGGDENSVLKALPKLKEMIIETVGTNIASNGSLNGAIRTYASK